MPANRVKTHANGARVGARRAKAEKHGRSESRAVLRLDRNNE